MEELCYRNEYKHLISFGAKYELKSRLNKILKKDKNSENGSYRIKSLYFDTIYDEALKEKIDGVSYREKFRIRYYNDEYNYIKLEKKVKEKNKGYKQYAVISKKDAEKIINGDIEFMKNSKEELLREFYIKSKTKIIKPKIMIQYEREAFVYPPGNTRITLDYNIRSSIDTDRFFDLNIPFVEVERNQCVLEVKFDRFIPALIKSLIQIKETTSTSHSKYATSRMAIM